MQENHSYDSYFGMLGRGDGFTLDSDGRPLNSNSDAHGNPVRAFHMANTCQGHSVSQNWNSSHLQWDNGKLDGFVRSPSGAAAMGYWDGSDLPFYYGLANTFPLCDRWFASVLRPDASQPPVHAVRFGARNHQHGRGRERRPAPKNGTIVEMLDRHGISWLDYNTVIPSLFLFPDVFAKVADKCPKIDQFFVDAAAGKLPSFCFVESNGETQSEEDPQDISMGEAFTAKVINALMRSPNWAKTVLVLCYDEHGGYYDHVPPPLAVAPDDIEPIFKLHAGEHLDGLPAELPGDYTAVRLPGAGGDRVALREAELRIARRARPHVDPEPGRAQVEPARSHQPRRRRRQSARQPRPQRPAGVSHSAEAPGAEEHDRCADLHDRSARPHP